MRATTAFGIQIHPGAKGIATEEMSDLSQHETETIYLNKPKAVSKLLQLPLVLVRDILEQIVHDYTHFRSADLLSVLRLRRVNSDQSFPRLLVVPQV
jgi:hypothetical protein